MTRGAVAANTSVDSDTEPTPARAYDSDLYDRGGYDGGLEGGGGYGTRTIPEQRLRPELRRDGG